MVEQVREIRECENCHAEMQALGKLPAIGAKPLIKVIKCSVATGAIAFKLTRNRDFSGPGAASNGWSSWPYWFDQEATCLQPHFKLDRLGAASVFGTYLTCPATLTMSLRRGKADLALGCVEV